MGLDRITWALCALAIGCTARGGFSGPTACTPGTIVACSCADGHTATQSCASNGAFDACRCGADAGATDVATADDATTDVATADVVTADVVTRDVSMADDATADVVTPPDASGCAAGLSRCAGTCVDTRSSAAHCGSCDRACPGGQSCQGGACVCAAGFHACGEVCARDTAPETCGDRCAPCPTAANGAATCSGGRCGVTCNTGFHLCGGACVSNTSVASCGASCTACPAGGGTPSCDGTRCGVVCPTGNHACAGACVSDTSVSSCGASCTPCPTSPNGVTRCVAAQCQLACRSGFVRCLAGCCAVTAAPVSGLSRASRVTLSVDATDRLHAVAQRATDLGAEEAAYLTATMGGAWTAESIGALSSTGLGRVTGRADGAGRVVACGAYNMATGDPAWRLDCVRREVGGAWRAVGSTTNATERVVGLDVAVASDGGFAALVREDIRGSAGSPRLRVARWTGSTFDTTSPDASYLETRAALSYDPSGRLVAAVNTTSGSSGCYSIFEQTGASWSRQNGGGMCLDGRYVGLAIGADGTIHTTYSTSYGNVVYARRAGAAWTRETVVMTPIEWVTDLDVAVDRAGNVHAVWVHAGSIGYGVRIDGAWQTSDSFLAGQTPVMAVDSRGGVHLLFVDRATMSWSYARW